MTFASEYTSWPPSRAAAANGSSAAEDRCAADPAAPLKDWIYEEAAIGFVLSGCFEYRTEGASVLAAPGAIVFGNVGEPFNVRHLDSLGNNRLVVFLKRDLLDEVASSSNLDEPRFRTIALPPGPLATRMFGWMRTFSHLGPDAEEILYPLAHAALTAQQTRKPDRIAPRDHQRVQSAVRYINSCFDEPCSLQLLAELTGLSRFHFVRTFGAVIGQSPNQYVINKRIRAAAELLLTSSTPITELALDVGFNDISHFYACFKAALGCTPRQWRKGAAR